MFFLDKPILINEKLSEYLYFKFELDKKEVFKSTVEELKKLWPKLAIERGLQQAREHYSFNQKQVKAYASYYLLANAYKAWAVLKEASLLGLDLLDYFKIKKNNQNNEQAQNVRLRTQIETEQAPIWLDLGCGPGTLFFGLDEFLNEKQNLDFKLNVLGVDQSFEFLNLASSFKFSEKLKANFLKNSLNPKKILELVERENIEVISFMNSISEIEPDLSKRIEFIKKLGSKWGKASNDCKFLLIIEPGSKKNSRELLELRKALIEEAGKLFRVWLPCLSNRSCGALLEVDDWCHEDIKIQFPKWHDDLSEAIGLRKESLLFSYLLISVGDTPKIMNWPKEASRVVSQRLEEKGLTRCWVCTEKLNKIQLRVLNSKMTEKNKIFKNIVRGDLITNFKLEDTNSKQGDLSEIEVHQKS